MKKITLVTDSTAYIDTAFLEKEGIHRVPLCVNFEGETNPEGLPGEFDPFFKRLSESKDFPSTSQPSVGDFKTVYEDIFRKNPDSEIIVITISSKLSGTFNSAQSAAKMLESDKISVIDSYSSAANLRHLVTIANELIKEGKTREEVVESIEKQKIKGKVFLTVGTLNYLKKGGRLSGSQAAIGSLLNVKPIIALEEGALKPIDKVRGRKKALAKMVALIHEKPSHISICHIDALDEAEAVSMQIQKKYPGVQVGIEQLGPVIGSHLGTKALGICYLY